MSLDGHQRRAKRHVKLKLLLGMLRCSGTCRKQLECLLQVYGGFPIGRVPDGQLPGTLPIGNGLFIVRCSGIVMCDNFRLRLYHLRELREQGLRNLHMHRLSLPC